MDVLWLMSAAVLVVLIQAIILGNLSMRKVTYQRYFSKKVAYQGDKVEMVEVMRNNKMLPVPIMKVETRMSPYLRFRAQRDETLPLDDFYHRSLFFLPPFRQITRRYELTCLRRGVYNVGTVSMTGLDLFGIGRRTRQIDVNAKLLVYPRLLTQQEAELPSVHLMGDVIVKRWINDDPFLVSGVRDYRTGDMPKDIHWRATARTGRLQVKMHDRTSDMRLMVLFNVQPKEDIWTHIPVPLYSVVDYGASVCATLCLQGLEGGLEVGLAANGSAVDFENENLFVVPERSAPHKDVIFEALARLRPHISESLLTYVEKTFVDMPRMDVVLVSAYDDEIIQKTLTLLRLRGHHAMLYPYTAAKEEVA